MMRDYGMNTDRMVNQLIPHYLGGRKLVLFVQSLLYPVQILANTFQEWATHTCQEAAMTSQVVLLKYFLNQRFSQYFLNPNDNFDIINTDLSKVVIYRQGTKANHKHIQMRLEQENKTVPFFRKFHEKQKYSGISFIVKCPQLKEQVYGQAMIQLKIFLDRYHITGKNYVIETKS